MDRHELWARASMAGQREASRVAFLARRPKWRREALAGALIDSRDLDPIRKVLAEKDWFGAHEQLMRHVVSATPRFAMVPADRATRVGTIRHQVPQATEAAIARADAVANGRFDLLGYRGLTFGDEGQGARPDWHLDPVHRRRAPDGFWTRVPYLAPESGDHKIIWELNRHQSWLTLGRAYWLTSDERYRSAFVSQFASWMPANPPLSGVNWASMLELGLRSLSWLWALQFFATAEGGQADESPWSVDLLLGLDRQLRLVERNLSWYFSPNTHLLGEALALYVVGRALPELRRASRWERLGGDVLVEQVARQIHRDGGHAELSTHYHRYTLDFYLLALAVARRTNDSRAETFSGAVQALARFARTMSDDAGRMPTIGDDDGGELFPICGRAPFDASDSLQMSAQLLDQPALAVGAPAEEVIWLTGTPAPDTKRIDWPSTALPDSGYYVSRSTRGDHLTVDAGPHGFLNGGHAHADALSIALTIQGRPFLVDPGTACYTIDSAVRDRFRSTQFHNTLTIDGRPQSTPAGPFHWESAAHGTALEWRSGNGFDLFAGTHDGYRPCSHHRTVLSRPGCWYVIDRVCGSGVRKADLHWHIDPSWRIGTTARRSVRAVTGDGRQVWLVTLGGDCEVFRGTGELGWHAPLYGCVLPITSVRASRTAQTPFRFVTAIVESDDEPLVIEAPIFEESGGRSAHGVAFTIRTSHWREIVLFTRWTDAGLASSNGLYTAGGVTTDARVLCWRQSDRDGDGASVLVDGQVVEREPDGGWRETDASLIKEHHIKEHHRSCAG